MNTQQNPTGISLRVNPTNWGHSGYWVGNSMTIQVEGEYSRGAIIEHTSLITQYNGKRYQRNYDRMFSDHGLKMICARFEKGILSGNFKKEKFQRPS